MNKRKNEEEIIDVEAEEVDTTPEPEMNQNQNEQSSEAKQNQSKEKNTSDEFNKAWKQVEEIGKETWNSIQKRTNVVMVRMDDDSLEKIDTLVDAKVCKSRSEAAAYLITKGIAAQQETFDEITELSKKINDLRGKMYDIAKDI